MVRDIQRTVCWVLLAGLLSTAGAFADSITGAGIWQDFPVTLESDRAPYMDSPSNDGARGNVAFFLSGYNGAYPAKSPHVTPQWYGDASGQAITDYYLNLGATTLTATLRLKNTGWYLLDEFGWYDVSNPSATHGIFAATDAVGANATFTPSAQYGYYMTNGLGETYYTQSELNPPSETSHQHFAAFRDSLTAESDRMWIGVEDQSLIYCGDEIRGDYNDMVVEIVGTPEPATVYVAGGGLMLLAFGLSWVRLNETRR
jgi:hypothetical protein